MKRFGYSFQGPAGEVEVKDPLLVRVVESTWFVVGLTVIFSAVGVYLLQWADRRIFLGRELSFPHRELKKDCLICHVPWKGVPNESCFSADCHAEVKNTIHNTLDDHCIACHPEHNDGGINQAVVENNSCVECHNRMAKDPDSPLHTKRRENRVLTYVPRQPTFSHMSHALKTKCYQCHCNGKDTINIDTKHLFQMKSCLVGGCHDQKAGDCKYCHKSYHELRASGPLELECLNRGELLNKLRGTKISMYCTEYAGRSPNFGDLTVCGTDLPIIPPKPPEPAPGSTAGP